MSPKGNEGWWGQTPMTEGSREYIRQLEVALVDTRKVLRDLADRAKEVHEFEGTQAGHGFALVKLRHAEERARGALAGPEEGGT